jgi:ribonuclease HI
MAGRPRPEPMAAPPGAVSVYTDGACSGNPGPGGWAWAVDQQTYASGGDRITTNQRMEVRAVLGAVTTLSAPLLVVSDSTYVVNCFRDRWWEKWLLNGWLTSARKPVMNRDLWEPLVSAVADRDDIAFHWVKGHSGHEMNDFVDGLAVAAALEAR